MTKFKIIHEKVKVLSKEEWILYYQLKKTIKHNKQFCLKNDILDAAEVVNPLNTKLHKLRQVHKKIQYYTLKRTDISLTPYSNTSKQFNCNENTFYAGLKEARELALKELRETRVSNQTPNYKERYLNSDEESDEESISYKMIGTRKTGYTFHKPLTILSLINLKQSKDIFKYKEPLNRNPHLGIELEFYCKWNKQELANEIIKVGLKKYCTIKRDSSIEPETNYIPHELCILVQESEYKQVIEQICNLLKQADAKVNKSCGFHVHIDMRGRDNKVVFSNLVSSQPILYSMNPSSRKAGRFCQIMKTKDIENAGSNRYVGINPTALDKHKTIEIRIHSGTVDFVKINNWITLLLNIVNQNDIKRTTRSFKVFLKQYNVQSELAEYMLDRIKKFNGIDESNEDVEAA